MSHQSIDLQATHRIIEVLEKTLQNSDLCIDYLSGVFAIIDEEGSILRGNIELADILNADIQGLNNFKLENLFENQEWPAFKEKLPKAKPGENYTFELTHIKDGIEHYYLWTIIYFFHPHEEVFPLYAVMGKDVSKLREAQNQLEELNRSLEQKVEKRTRELQEKNDELVQTIEKLKSTQDKLIQKEKMASFGALTSGLAHELKNPLNFVNNGAQTIKAHLENLNKEGELSWEKEGVHELLGLSQSVMQSGRRIEEILETIFLFSRDQSSGPSPIDFSSFIKKYSNMAFLELENLYGEELHQIERRVEIQDNLDIFYGREKDLGRAIFNLLKNSIESLMEKKEEGPKVITIQVKSTGETLEISLKDTGEGIPKAQMKEVFIPFFTTRPTGKGSVGLGLSTTYDIITMGLKGELYLKSEEGKFTEVIIEVPHLKKKPEVEKERDFSPPEERKPYSSPLNILMVDDEMEAQLLYKVKFKNEIKDENVTIDFALSGNEALELLKSKGKDHFDLILSDINMPGMTGFELLEKVREFDRAIPIIMVTAYNDSERVEEAIRLKANGLINKPIKFDALKERIFSFFPKES